jgi:EmrB/QacA subfamily drug resistance transporter
MTIALVLVLGMVMVTLDQTVVNVAINRLSQDFDAPLATIQWVSTGYSLALGAVIPSAAWAIGRFGGRRLYLFAIALFAGASLLTGLAWNIESLIAFRVLQGLGGGLVMPVGMTILMRAAPPERRGALMSTLGLAVLIGPLAGPVLGGYLIDEVSWRWMFFINLPIGILVLALSSRLFPRDQRQPAQPLDVRGLLMLSPGLAALLYGVTTGGDRGDFGSPEALVPLLLGVALIGAFVFRALTARHPLIDLRLFRDRTFTAGAGVLTLFACGYFGSMLLLPLYLQVVRGESATMAGLLGIPWALASGLTMQVTGRLVDRVAPGLIVLTGMGLAVTGFGLFALQLSADASYWRLGGSLLLMGMGGGMTMMPTMTAATQRISHEQVPAASTTLNLINTTVAAIGVAVSSVVLSAGIAARTPGDAGELADAFQHTYAWIMVPMILALIPALFLPRRRT